MSQAQTTTGQFASAGRGSASGGTGNGTGNASGNPPPPMHPDDVTLENYQHRYDQLGETPPEFNIANNDAAHGGDGAHTGERHGPDVPLGRDPGSGTRTVEGRIYGDPPWPRPENWSYRWDDHGTMNRTVNDHVRDNWEQIRNSLAMDGAYSGQFDAGHRVGEGYYNNGMYGAGPRDATYTATSFVKIFIQTVPGSDPPVPFVVTAYPAGM